ncbi:HepT-like ribonuclease domain-containing protein [Roseospira navarrensis]|uniref:DUF86 domain-containing protein n=1 Tax=Roseospira navarrensis TaxID=140058 RepID=A0A7X1ZD26_9PROT|nr:HepT-like ribonuclease domain-containing protein [Roseospira navarrensis]MQX35281.1 DUF86 domain-containing protein [Roseospira navarrensis]
MTADRERFSLGDLLGFMIDAVQRIELYLEDVQKEDFLADAAASNMIRDAVVFNIGVLGEVAHDIERSYPDYAKDHPEIPFSRLYAMRNHIFHGYHSINYEIVWTTCVNSIGPLMAVLVSAREDLPS